MSIPLLSVPPKDADSTNILLSQDGQDKPIIVGVDIGIEKDSSFLVIIVDGMYFFEPL